MERIKTTGTFITIDGPNGVGKSTIIKKVKGYFDNCGIESITTKEPTDSFLGDFLIKSSEQYDGKSLACMVAADRYAHIEKIIKPNIAMGRVVISDRYFESSIVLQKLDGVDTEFIIKINSEILIPDLSIILLAHENNIEERLSKRINLTRFEKSFRRLDEIELYRAARKIILDLGFNVHIVYNDDEIESTMQEIEELIESIKR